MPEYFTDFREYAVGAKPADWTHIWIVHDTWYTVMANAAAIGGQQLNLDDVVSDATNRTMLGWDDIVTVAGDTVELLVKVRVNGTPATTGNTVYARFGLRTFAVVNTAAKDGIDEKGYMLDYMAGQIRLAKYTPTFTSLATSAWTVTGGEWVWLRFRAEGTTISARIWKDGTAEPATWTASVTDSAYNQGTTGAGQYYAQGTSDVDVFGVAVGGGSAPATAPATGAISGTAAGTLPALTGASAATVKPPPIAGTAAGTLPLLTGTSAATMVPPPIAGSAAGTLPVLTGASAATVKPPPIAGTATGTLPLLQGSSAATVKPPPIAGSAAGTLPVLTGVSAATATAPGNVAGSATGILPLLQGSSAATATLPPIAGTVSATLPNLQGASAATVTLPPIAGTASGTLPRFRSNSAAVVLPPPIAGRAAGMLPAFQGSAAAILNAVLLVPITVYTRVLRELVCTTKAKTAYTVHTSVSPVFRVATDI